MNRRIIRMTFVPLAAATAAFAGYLLWVERPPRWTFGEGFSEGVASFELYDLYDVGMARIDADRRLDLFTVNHSSVQYAVFGDGVTAPLFELGLGQDTNYPGVEDAATEPTGIGRAIVLFRESKRLHVEDRLRDESELVYPIALSVAAPWPLSVERSDGATVRKSDSTDDPTLPDGFSGLRIELDVGGSVVLVGQEDILELPHRIAFDDPAAARHARLGASGLRPREERFELSWRDRHSMAWRDHDGDGDSDVFIARGGVKGQLSRVPVDIRDELLLRDGAVYRDIATEAGLVKGSCPARQTAWVDVNADGEMDLYVSCGRVAEARFPNQLHVADGVGGFTERGEEFGLDFPGVSVFRWFDADRDGDTDMLSADGATLALYRNDGGTFRREVVVESLASKPAHLVIVDLDDDGFLDAATVQSSTSLLLRNRAGEFAAEELSAVGLPSSLRALAFLDTDNDGTLDAHAVPGGVYRGDADGRFTRSGALDDGRGTDSVSAARCTWFDRDIDGRHDVVCAIERYPSRIVRAWKKLIRGASRTRFWTLHSATRTTSGDEDHRWLQLDLDAGDRNPEGIGALVRLTAGDRSRFQVVGQHEGSHYSQGHYRLYFGLGRSNGPYRALVFWPDGVEEEFVLDGVDRLTTLTRGAGSSS